MSVAARPLKANRAQGGQTGRGCRGVYWVQAANTGGEIPRFGLVGEIPRWFGKVGGRYCGLASSSARSVRGPAPVGLPDPGA